MPVTKARAQAMDYKVIKIRTVMEETESGLSFLEGERDIPFKINHLYCIFEKEKNNQNGFLNHKQSWQLLLCPYGSIEVLVDNGIKRERISLDNPSIGLILRADIWREMIWKEKGSVLCIASSSDYDVDKFDGDYAAYLDYVRKQKQPERK